MAQSSPFTLQRSRSQTYRAMSTALTPNSYQGAGQILSSHRLNSATRKMGNKIFLLPCYNYYCLGWLDADVSALLEEFKKKKKSCAKAAQAKKHSQGVCTNAARVRKSVHSISNLREEPLPSSAAAARHPHRLIPWLPPAQLRRLAPRPLSQAAALPSLSSTQAALCSSLLKVTLCRAYSSFLAEDSSIFFFFFFPLLFFLPTLPDDATFTATEVQGEDTSPEAPRVHPNGCRTFLGSRHDTTVPTGDPEMPQGHCCFCPLAGSPPACADGKGYRCLHHYLPHLTQRNRD